MSTNKVVPSELSPSKLEFGLDPVKADLATKGSRSGSDFSSNGSLTTSESYSSSEKRPGGLSARATLVNFVKGMIGPGCLSLPMAFHQAGLWTALALIFVFGFLNNYCMLQLVECSQRLARKKGNNTMDYGAVAYHACAHSFKPLRKFKKAFKFLTNTVIIMLQLGICSVFYVFVASHVKELFDEFSVYRFDTTVWSLMVLGPMILVNLIRTLKAIAVLSIFGNVCMICSLIFIMQYLVRQPFQFGSLPTFTDFDGILMACGSVLYSFEGQAMVLPMENKLRKPDHMVGPFGVLSVGMTIVTFVYAACGFFGYIVYGEHTQGSITLNLPNTTMFTIVKALLIFVIYSGFVIQQYVIVDMLWPPLKKLMKLENMSFCVDFAAEAVFRTLLVLLELTLAVAVPRLDDIIPLVGATAGMLLAFVFPAVIDTMTFGPDLVDKAESDSSQRPQMIWRFVKNGLLVVLGIFGLIAGLQSNVRALIHGH